MILVDFSSSLHRRLSTQIKNIKPSKINGKYVTSDYQNYWKCLILEELFSLYLTYKPYLGKEGIVLCLDYHNKKYWRKDFYPQYKEQRNKQREESEINFEEFFEMSNKFTDVLIKNTPWKVFETEGQEADDIIMVLAKEFQNKEPVLIYSPDKDFIQCQRYSENIKQYSPMTRKWITPDTKSGSMHDWIMEHICLGDKSDNVPKIVEDTIFSSEFIQYMKDKEREYIVHDWKKLPHEDQRIFLEDFEPGFEGVYKKMRFGSQALRKKIEEHGNLMTWINSDIVLKEHFDRNYTLVMQEGIPNYLSNQILKDFYDQSTEYDSNEFDTYLKENNLNSLVPMLPREFRGELTQDFFDW